MGQYNLEHFLMWAGPNWSSPAITRVIFGPLDPWIGAWKGKIWP